MLIQLKVKKLDKNAALPQYAHLGDAGFDLVANQDARLFPGIPTVVGTGLAFQIPSGFEIQVRSRSGLSTKGVCVANSPGTLDSGYLGEVKLIMINHGKSIYDINRGDRIAQGVLAEVPIAVFVEVEELGESERGVKGLGSTGVK